MSQPNYPNRGNRRTHEVVRSPWPLYLGVALILLGGGGFAVWQFVLKPRKQGENPPDRGGEVAGGSTTQVGSGTPPVVPPEADPKAPARAKLQRIVSAAQKHASRTDTLPNDVYAGGAAVLSWRVAILPDLGLEPLYKEFRLNEPWDSEHNKKLVGKMPDVFALVGSGTDGRTFVQGFVAPGTVKPRPLFVAGDKTGLKLSDVVDGTSNTAFCAEAATASEWTRPGGIRFDAKSPPAVGGNFGSGALVVLLDGRVQWVPAGPDQEKTVRRMATVDGGEVADQP